MYFFIENNIPNKIVKSLSAIDEFKGEWFHLKNLEPELSNELKRTTIITSTGASTRIEGADLSDQEIEARLKGLKIDKISDRSAAEVQGYVEDISDIFNNYSEMKFSENLIKYIHKKLLKYVSKDQRHLGEYKKMPNDVGIYEDGKFAGVIMKTSSPFDTPFQMEKLIAEFNKLWNENNIHKLLLISEFIIIFLKIHPFQDGNGRTSRLLTNLLFLKAGYTFTEYSSHEKIIEDNKQEYYIQLRRGQKKLDEKKTPEEWTVFFLETILIQIKILKAKTALKDIGTSKTEEAILKLFEIHSKLTNQMVHEKFGYNQNTIRAAFQRLTQKNKIIAFGKNKNRFYKLYSPYVNLKNQMRTLTPVLEDKEEEAEIIQDLRKLPKKKVFSKKIKL